MGDSVGKDNLYTKRGKTSRHSKGDVEILYSHSHNRIILRHQTAGPYVILIRCGADVTFLAFGYKWFGSLNGFVWTFHVMEY